MSSAAGNYGRTGYGGGAVAVYATGDASGRMFFMAVRTEGAATAADIVRFACGTVCEVGRYGTAVTAFTIKSGYGFPIIANHTFGSTFAV